MPELGGGYNLVAFVTMLTYVVINGKLPGEITFRDKAFKWFILLFILSSILGWLTNYTGTDFDIIYSVTSFFGMVTMLILASRVLVTEERIKIFIKLNMILITYATVASLNKYIRFVPTSTPILPIYGENNLLYFEGGGTIGSSPLYGEHSLLLAILFAVFLFIYKREYFLEKSLLIVFLILSIINVFMSISRSVFLLLILGLVFVLIFQYKISNIHFAKQFVQIFLILFIGIGINIIIQSSELGYSLDRIEEISQKNKTAGGLTAERILDGSAFNRAAAFEEGFRKYESKESWLIGYGWGLTKNNRDAFYVNTEIKRGSAHSQIFAILFIFGWIGFIAYFGLIMRVIFRSYKIIGNRKYILINRVVAYFFMIVFVLFFLNEIKVDSVSMPGYFTATMILLGFAYANINTATVTRLINKF